MTKHWASAARVEVDSRSFEQRLWDEFSLALIFPRQVPEWIDDVDINEHLYRLHATERLPWELW